MIKFTGNLRLDFEKATAEITKLKDRILGYQEQIASLQASARNLRRSKECDKKQYAETLAGKDAIIKELQNRLAHAEALLNHDGSNTGKPTSQTPINKTRLSQTPAVIQENPREDRPAIQKPSLRCLMNPKSQILSGIHCRMMNAAPSAGLLTVFQPGNPR